MEQFTNWTKEWQNCKKSNIKLKMKNTILCTNNRINYLPEGGGGGGRRRDKIKNINY
jgi:hypothetical protein